MTWVMVLLILSSFVSAELVGINSNSNSSSSDQGKTLLVGLTIRDRTALTDGIRNPLYPALLSLFAQRDLSYFTKAKFLSLAIGLAVLLTVYLLGRRLYSSGVGLVVMFLLSINNEFRWASFNVLVEVLLVLLFLFAWYCVIKGLAESNCRYLAWAGFFGGLVYLTKGTGMLLSLAFLVSIAIIAIVYKRIPAGRGTLSFLLPFVVVSSILWVYNYRVYRNPLFNYGTTYAMWLEEWEEFYSLQSFPTVFTYLKTHTFQEIVARQWAGMKAMAHTFTDVLLWLKSSSIHGWLKSPFVLVPALIIIVGLTLYSRERVISYWQRRKDEVIFTSVLVTLFYLTFAWYAQVLADSRFPLPLVPILYLVVTGFLWELGSGLLARFDLVGDTRLTLVSYVAFCALSLPLLGSDLIAFKFEDPFQSDRLNNLERMEVMSWLEREVETGTVIAYEPGHALPTWMYADRYDFIVVPYKASWQTVESYLEERGARYIIFNRELLARRKPLYGHFLYRKESMRIDVLALPSSWDLALAYGGLPCQYCIFRLNWPESGEADEAWQHARLGDADRSQGEVVQAIAEYEEALERGSKGWPGLHVALGRSYQAAGLLDGAVEEYKAAIELGPEEAWYHTLLGEAYLSQGRAEKALSAYMEALALGAEGWPSLHQALGQVYEALDRPEEAIAEYKEAIRLEPDDAGHHKLLGDLYRFQGEMEKAAVEYEKVIELDGHRWPDLHVALGQAYEALSRPDEARAEYGKAGLDHIGPTRFGDSILLLGYGTDESELAEGKVRLDLYWQCLQEMSSSYTVYLKLVNPVYHVWGQGDSSPAPPTHLWRRGMIVKDTRQLAVLPATPPGTYSIEVILWDAVRQQNLETASGEPLLLGPLEMPPWESLTVESLDIEHPMRVNLGNKVLLLGYNLESGFRPGDSTHLTLFWQALAEMEENYTVFTHLIEEQGTLWGQKDDYPVDGFYPTSRWKADEIVRDQYDILISSKAPPGEYQIEVGMYLAETGERLEVFSKNSASHEDRVLLSQGLQIGP